VPEAIGNLSEKYPQEVEEAIPELLKNVKEDSTVIRWCAAYALNGVQNVYQKVLKLLDKGG